MLLHISIYMKGAISNSKVQYNKVIQVLLFFSFSKFSKLCFFQATLTNLQEYLCFNDSGRWHYFPVAQSDDYANMRFGLGWQRCQENWRRQYLKNLEDAKTALPSKLDISWPFPLILPPTCYNTDLYGFQKLISEDVALSLKLQEPALTLLSSQQAWILWTNALTTFSLTTYIIPTYSSTRALTMS